MIRTPDRWAELPFAQPLALAVFEPSTYLPPIASYSGPTSRRISSPHSENNGGEQRPITAARRLRTAKEALKEPEQSRPRLPQSVSEHGLCFAASSATRSFALGALPFIRRALDLDALGLPNRGSPLDRYLQDPDLKASFGEQDFSE